MNQRSKYLFKNLGILTISNFASKILVFLLVPLYTSVLTTTEYGTYDLVVSTVSLLYPVLTIDIVTGVMRFAMDKRCAKGEIVLIAIKYLFGSICILGFGLYLLHWLQIFPGLNGLKVYIFLYYSSYVLNQFFIQFAKGLEKVADMGVAGILGTIVMLGGNVFFLLVLKTGLQGFFVANILAQTIPVIYFFLRLKFWNFFKYAKRNKQLEKQMISYCAPMIFTALSWWINSTLDKYVVSYMCGVAANGILSVAYKIPSIINTLQNIFMQAWQISAIKEYGEKGMNIFYGKFFLYLNIFMSVACSGIILLSKPFAYIMYANEFYSAWQYVPFLLVSSVFNCASGFIGPILSAKKDSKSMAMSAIYGAVANVIMNIIFVYLMGVQGATIATGISSYIIYYFRKRSTNEELKIEKYWRVLFTWGLLVAQAVFEVYFDAWYAEIIIMVILLVLNRTILAEAIGILKRKGTKNESSIVYSD